MDKIKREPIDIDFMNNLSAIKINFDEKKYFFDNLSYIIINGMHGSYSGMVDIISKKPSGFGRFYNTLNIFEG